MTETDDPPDLERLEPGHEVRVTYVSDRSGNEVDRTGVVASTGHTDAGRRLVRVHTEEKHPLKHVYVALLEVETDDGDEYVGAWSLTAQADRDGVDEPPKVGKTYRYRLTPERTSFLGLTDRVVRQGGPTPVLVTDGGRGPIKEPDDGPPSDPALRPCIYCGAAVETEFSEGFGICRDCETRESDASDGRLRRRWSAVSADDRLSPLPWPLVAVGWGLGVIAALVGVLVLMGAGAWVDMTVVRPVAGYHPLLSLAARLTPLSLALAVGYAWVLRGGA